MRRWINSCNDFRTEATQASHLRLATRLSLRIIRHCMSEQSMDTVEETRTPHAIDREAPVQTLAQQIEEVSAGEAARVMQGLPTDKAADVAQYLDPNTAGAIIAKMDVRIAAEVVGRMAREDAGAVLSAMNPDDRVDILGRLPLAVHDELVKELNTDEQAEVKHLEQFPPDTAGGIMTSQVTALYEYITVDNAIQLLRRLNEELEQMFYVYVINRTGRLVGVLSMRDLILAKPDSQLRNIMIKSVRSVPATMKQEDVAKLMRNYGYLAVPVVDAEQNLLGIITLDDVIDVIQTEATEEFQRAFGAGAEERLTSPWFYSFKKRIWWLEVNLLTAFLAAAVVSLFTETIAAVPILAAYQTIVSGMGGNGGAQAMAVAIRGIATGESGMGILKRALKKQFMVGLWSGIVIGITTGAIAAIFNWSHHGPMLGLVVFAALFFNHINACITGVCIPFVMKRFGFDPAQSSTIFATTFTDCGGFFACLGLAKLLMPWLIDK
jgi:magnesium transporter